MALFGVFAHADVFARQLGRGGMVGGRHAGALTWAHALSNKYAEPAVGVSQNTQTAHHWEWVGVGGVLEEDAEWLSTTRLMTQYSSSFKLIQD